MPVTDPEKIRIAKKEKFRKEAYDYWHKDNNKKLKEIANSDYDGTAVYTVMNQIEALLALSKHAVGGKYLGVGFMDEKFDYELYRKAVKRAIRYFTKAEYDPYYPTSVNVAAVFKHAQFEIEAGRKLSIEEVNKILHEDYELEPGGRFIKKGLKAKELEFDEDGNLTADETMRLIKKFRKF